MTLGTLYFKFLKFLDGLHWILFHTMGGQNMAWTWILSFKPGSGGFHSDFDIFRFVKVIASPERFESHQSFRFSVAIAASAFSPYVNYSLTL